MGWGLSVSVDELIHHWLGSLHHPPGSLYRPLWCLHRPPSSQSGSTDGAVGPSPGARSHCTARAGSWSSPEGPGQREPGLGALPVPFFWLPFLPVHSRLMWKLPLERRGEGLRVCPRVSLHLCSALSKPCVPHD